MHMIANLLFNDFIQASVRIAGWQIFKDDSRLPVLPVEVHVLLLFGYNSSRMHSQSNCAYIAQNQQEN